MSKKNLIFLCIIIVGFFIIASFPSAISFGKNVNDYNFEQRLSSKINKNLNTNNKDRQISQKLVAIFHTSALITEDIDQDGMIDIVAADYYEDYFSWWRNLGNDQ
jgi:hypothetical protein